MTGQSSAAPCPDVAQNSPHKQCSHRQNGSPDAPVDGRVVGAGGRSPSDTVPFIVGHASAALRSMCRSDAWGHNFTAIAGSCEQHSALPSLARHVWLKEAVNQTWGCLLYETLETSELVCQYRPKHTADGNAHCKAYGAWLELK